MSPHRRSDTLYTERSRERARRRPTNLVDKQDAHSGLVHGGKQTTERVMNSITTASSLTSFCVHCFFLSKSARLVPPEVSHYLLVPAPPLSGPQSSTRSPVHMPTIIIMGNSIHVYMYTCTLLHCIYMYIYILSYV